MNQKVRTIFKEVLSDNWNTLRKFTFDYLRNGGTWQT